MPYKFPFSALFTQHVFYKKKLISSLACFSQFLCLLVKYRIVGVRFGSPKHYIILF